IRPLSREEQPEADARLQWTPVPGAVRYRVQVSTENLRAVLDRTLAETSLIVPRGLADLGTERITREQQRGRGFLWQVEARLPAGRPVPSPPSRIGLPAAPPEAPR